MNCPSCGSGDYFFGMFGHNCVNASCEHYKKGKINDTVSCEGSHAKGHGGSAGELSQAISSLKSLVATADPFFGYYSPDPRFKDFKTTKLRDNQGRVVYCLVSNPAILLVPRGAQGQGFRAFDWAAGSALDWSKSRGKFSQQASLHALATRQSPFQAIAALYSKNPSLFTNPVPYWVASGAKGAVVGGATP